MQPELQVVPKPNSATGQARKSQNDLGNADVSHLTDFEQRVAANWDPGTWSETRVVIAVSGGADSVCLLRVLLKIAHATSLLSVVHVNHGLRKESCADEAFVSSLCRQFDVKFQVFQVSSEQIEHFRPSQGWEAAARRVRYDLLRKQAETAGARYVATGHTADDQAETVLHNIMRGTGLDGLKGIPRSRTISEAATLIRPLLPFTRSEILAYLDSLGQAYVLDESNDHAIYTRNRIRNQILPLIEQEVNASAREHLCRLADLSAEISSELDRIISLFEAAIVEESTDRVRIDTTQLSNASELVVSHFLIRLWQRKGWPMRDMDFERWRKLSRLVSAGGESCQRVNLPGVISVTLDGAILEVEKLAE